jgi:Tfp pilus assembly protein PilF
MAQQPIDEQVGQAWQYHRQGDNQNAIAQFEAIVKQNPSNIDANYGLGLVQRALGRGEQAFESFQKALDLVNAAERHENNIEERDRYLILTRMINQRLAETKTVK